MNVIKNDNSEWSDTMLKYKYIVLLITWRTYLMSHKENQGRIFSVDRDVWKTSDTDQIYVSTQGKIIPM